jgi:hypothetical protein
MLPGVAMSWISVLTTVAASSKLLVATADDLPTYNLSPSCRSETTSQAGDQGCLKDEQRAKDTLLQQWSEFSPVDRANCLSVEEAGGAPSYVELLTCLQMAGPAGRHDGN